MRQELVRWARFRREKGSIWTWRVGHENASTVSMNISTSLNGNYLSSMLSHQLTTNSLNKPTSQASKAADPSPFAQLLNEASAGMGGNAAASSKGGGGSQLLRNIMSLF